MKKELHPKNYDVTAHCACGNRFQTSSTSNDLSVAICSNCHPYFTNTSKLLDTAGRIERFSKKYAKVNSAKETKAPEKKVTKKKKA